MTFQNVIRPPTLVETVSEKLAEIGLRNLRPQVGGVPVERELSERLGVSRSVVREATRRPTTQGLAEFNLVWRAPRRQRARGLRKPSVRRFLEPHVESVEGVVSVGPAADVPLPAPAEFQIQRVRIAAP